MPNKRLYWAVYAVGIAPFDGANYNFQETHGLQSIGMTTTFNLEQVFEIGQLSLYENIEGIPNVEITMEKVLDGWSLLYHMATENAPSATLAGRSNQRCHLGISYYSDVQENASGVPISQVTCSGTYVSTVSYRFPVEGNFTESITLVGNDKVWKTSIPFTFSGFFSGFDAPIAAQGVNRRQDLDMGACFFPTEIPGISASGTNDKSGVDFAVHMQNITVSTNLGRDQLFELGRKGTYFRFVNFPVEVTTEIEILDIEGDQINAAEEAENLTNQTILIKTLEGTTIDLGDLNKLASVRQAGGNAGARGSNVTTTWSYRNFNDFTVQHTGDPTVALRP